MLPKVQSKEASSLTNSSVSDLDKTLPKKPFRINSKASVAVSTEDKRAARPLLRDTKKPVMTSQSSQISAPAKSVNFKLNDLAAEDNDGLAMSDLANQILTNRVKEDRKIYEEFLERLGLMKYYDRLWEIGIDSLDGLSRVTVEDFNHMFIPAGTQIRIQLELKKAGHGAANHMKDVSMGTEDEGDSNMYSGELQSKAQTKTRPALNFGINMKKSQAPFKPAMCSMAIETDPVDDKDIPLNVDEDLGKKHSLEPPQNENKSQVLENKSLNISSKRSTVEMAIAATSTEDVEPDVSKPFSFAGLGGAEWTNYQSVPYDFSSSSVNNNSSAGRPLQTSSAGTMPRKLKVTNRVACYGCFKQVEPEDTLVHKHLPSRVMFSNQGVLL